MTKPQLFNPFNTRLQSGINLIEASAGTGKTYSITMLVVRYLLEQNVTIDQLLVVTFTNAAARELRQRIRQRLLEVRGLLVSGKPCDDEGVNEWLVSLDTEPALLIQTLNLALADLDYASIVTIHSFCQRTLGQYALESGQGFNSALIDNIAPLKQQIVEDFWRIQMYSRSLPQVLVLCKMAKNPQELLKSIAGFATSVVLLPKLKSLDQCLDDYVGFIEIIPDHLGGVLESTALAVDSDSAYFKNKFIESFANNKHLIEQWLASDNRKQLPLEAIFSLSTDMLDGRKLKTDQKKHLFLQRYGIDFIPLERLKAYYQHIQMVFKADCYYYLQDELSKRLIQANQLSHNDVIANLANALKDNNETTKDDLKSLLQAQFPIAMIDEFQDTDKAQWSIFSSLVDADSSNTLYLIGDPKQAIYKFRGADIYAYLAAQHQASHHYTLATNYRSQASLVEGVNAFFSVDDPFAIKAIGYYPVDAANEDGVLLCDGESYEKLAFRALEANPKKGNWASNRRIAKEHIQAHVVDEICHLLTVKHRIQIAEDAVMPADIAILVRSNKTAAEYQQALSAVGVPSIVNSKSSVFHSVEAKSLLIILQAIARPYHLAGIRYALCQAWFGYDGQGMYALLDDAGATEKWLIDFQRYHERWHEQGVLIALNELMSECDVVQHLSSRGELERTLTNIHHLLEVLQLQASEKKMNMSKLLQWFTAVQQDVDLYDAQVLRLESDKEAINIVTVHGAKGLEYPIVFCPDLWRHDTDRDKSTAHFTKDQQAYVDLGSDAFDQHKALEDNEQQAENLRLLYVAITRAKYRCIVYWVSQNNPKSSLSYILEQHAGSDWHHRLASLQQAFPEFIEYSELPCEYEVTPTLDIQQNHQQEPLQCRSIKREINPNPWVMSSYSGLAHHSMDVAVLPELPVDKVEENEARSVVKDELPKGAHTGNLVHDLLEYNSFASLAVAPLTQDYIVLRDEGITRYAGDSHFDTDLLDELLQHTVNTALSVDDLDFTLANLSESQCLKEMPFYFKVAGLKTQDINTLLSYDPAYLALNWQQMRGQLTGFIDLVCEYQGRYYVMDYKTNYLEHYTKETMTQAMHEHNYGLQYWLYSLVLHRYLQKSLAGYDYSTHFGGVRYLFVRGMNPDVPCSGVFESYPELSVLEDFAAIFDEGV
ncbi:MAG: exodeoxyribonuclease V subunit beta [Thiotrichaceae bacterium]|nr:exodeoxyribonuclease V subunit beta [Thiotrichaceae bacterium]